MTSDATRRTRLANERTFLAWWRTGLATSGVSLVVGRLLPEVAGGTTWPYAALGVVFAAGGALIAGCGWWRWSAVEATLTGGEEAAAPRWVIASLGLLGSLASAGVAAVVVAGS